MTEKCKGFPVITPTKHLLPTVAGRAHALRTAPPHGMKKGLTSCLFLLKYSQQNLVCQERWTFRHLDVCILLDCILFLDGNLGLEAEITFCSVFAEYRPHREPIPSFVTREASGSTDNRAVASCFASCCSSLTIHFSTSVILHLHACSQWNSRSCHHQEVSFDF